MDSKALLYKQILKNYDKKRQKAQRELSIRTSYIYETIPEIKKIDGELNSHGFKLAKIALSDSSTLEQHIEELHKNNQYLNQKKEMLLQENGFSTNFLEIQFECPLCKDTGFINEKQCTCMKQQLIDKAYDQSNILEIIKTENFSSFSYDFYSENSLRNEPSPRENMKLIVAQSQKFIHQFHTTFQNLIFYGKTGLGKTFLCNCIAKEILDMGYTVLYVSSFQLFQTFERYRFLTSRETESENREAISFILESDLLIIDDLGSEFSTALTTVELFNCLNTRLINKKPTIISTNLTPNDLKNQYSDRIASRIFGYYKVCKFYGTDIRMNKKHGL